MAPREPRAARGFAAAVCLCGLRGAAGERVVFDREAVPSPLALQVRGVFHVPEAAGADSLTAASAVFEDMAVQDTEPNGSCQRLTAALVPVGAVGMPGGEGVWCEADADGNTDVAFASNFGHVRLDLASGAAPKRLVAGIHAGVWALVIANCVPGQAADACQVSGAVATARPSWQRFLGGDQDANIPIHVAAFVVNAMLLLSYRRFVFRQKVASINALVSWTACVGCIAAAGSLAQLWFGGVHGESSIVLLAVVELCTAIRIGVVASMLLWVSEGFPPRQWVLIDHRAEVLCFIAVPWTHHVLSIKREVGPSEGLLLSGGAMILAGLCLFGVVCRNLLRLRAPVDSASQEGDEKAAAAKEAGDRVRQRVPATAAVAAAMAAGGAFAISAHLLGDPHASGLVLWAWRAVGQHLLPEALCVGGVVALAALWAKPETNIFTLSMPDPLLQV